VIDFRYHLVSIVAVFLALGLGLVLGSTALQPYVVRTLKKASANEKARIDQLFTAQGQLKGEIAGDQAFLQAAAHQLVGNLLAGEHVVLVTAPGAPGQVTTGISQLLKKDAGAVVTGEVQLQPSFVDNTPATNSKLAAITKQAAAQVGTTLVAGSPVAQAGQVIGGALLTRDGPGQPVAGQRDSSSKAVLTGFAAAGFLTVSGQPPARATLAVVIVPAAPPSTNPSNPASQALVTFAQQLKRAGRGTVVAGSVSGSGPGSAIDVMRNGGRAGGMSSVDNADYAIGQIVVAQALYGQLNGVSGSYGWTSSANSAGPSPVPSAPPSATPTATPRSQRGKRPTPAPSPSVTP